MLFFIDIATEYFKSCRQTTSMIKEKQNTRTKFKKKRNAYERRSFQRYLTISEMVVGQRLPNYSAIALSNIMANQKYVACLE